MSPSRLRNALLVLVLLVASLAIVLALRSDPSSTTDVAPDELPAPAVTARVPVAVVDVDAPADSVARVPAARIALTSTGATRVDPTASAGRLRIRAVDEQTGAAVLLLRVRVTSGDRIADRSAMNRDGELEMLLTPAEWRVLVTANGYERVELAPTAVISGDSVSRTVELRRGSARIAGLVRGGVEVGDVVRVELIGAGRRPCAACADPNVPAGGKADDSAWIRSEPCATCGFAFTCSRLDVASDGAFAFDRLASGQYALRLVDAQGRAIGATRALELREGEACSVQLAAPERRTVVVEIVDTDGESLAPEWGRRVRTAEAEGQVDMTILVEHQPWDCTFRAGERVLATASLVPPRIDRSAVGVTTFAMSCGIGGKPRSIDDRLRLVGEELEPVEPAPEFALTAIACEVDADGLVRFLPLTFGAQTLEIAYAHFRGSVAIPASRRDARIRLSLGIGLEAPLAGDESAPAPRAATFREHELAR